MSLTNKNEFVEYVTDGLMDGIRKKGTGVRREWGMKIPVLHIPEEVMSQHWEQIRNNVEAFYEQLKIPIESGNERAWYMDIYADAKSLKRWIQNIKTKSNFSNERTVGFENRAQRMVVNITKNLAAQRS